MEIIEKQDLAASKMLVAYALEYSPSWQQGSTKEAFFNRFNMYSTDFTSQIQQLENALVVIIDTRKALETYYLSANTIM